MCALKHQCVVSTDKYSPATERTLAYQTTESLSGPKNIVLGGIWLTNLDENPCPLTMGVTSGYWVHRGLCCPFPVSNQWHSNTLQMTTQIHCEMREQLRSTWPQSYISLPPHLFKGLEQASLRGTGINRWGLRRLKAGLPKLETSLGYIVPGQGYMAKPWLKK